MIDLSLGEQIVYRIRRHWFIFLGPVLFTVLGVIVPPALVFSVSVPQALSDFSIMVNGADATNLMLMFVYFLWLLFLWIGLFIRWTDYYLDVWYVTDRRVIEIEQHGFFNRHVSSMPFDKIQDITIETKGIFATLLNFGDLKVETAGDKEGNFMLPHATRPHKAKEIILRGRTPIPR
ncbi:MAG: PH domain-containing protein [Patescibacteria group bacterium]